MARFIFFLFVLQSCSADYHLRQAIKKNPRLGDSTTIMVPFYKDTNIVVTIIGDTSDQNVKFKQWYKQATDSMTVAFNDSFVEVNQTIDSLGNLKTKVIRKPYHDTVRVVIRETKFIKAPAQIIVKEDEFKIKWYIWVLLAIFVIAFCIKKL
jgi:hypothetical protein